MSAVLVVLCAWVLANAVFGLLWVLAHRPSRLVRSDLAVLPQPWRNG